MSSSNNETGMFFAGIAVMILSVLVITFVITVEDNHIRFGIKRDCEKVGKAYIGNHGWIECKMLPEEKK